MILYLLVIIFFILLLQKREKFSNIIDITGGEDYEKIYRGFYKCLEYEDLRLKK